MKWLQTTAVVQERLSREFSSGAAKQPPAFEKKTPFSNVFFVFGVDSNFFVTLITENLVNWVQT